MGDTQRGDPTPLKKWASVTVPTLVIDGTMMMGREDFHAFMRHGADALAKVPPTRSAALWKGKITARLMTRSSRHCTRSFSAERVGFPFPRWRSPLYEGAIPRA
jgi:hypothetical protein